MTWYCCSQKSSTRTGTIDQILFRAHLHWDPVNSLALLHVNKQLAAEAAERFYSINSFQIINFDYEVYNTDGKCRKFNLVTWLQSIGRNAQHIRKFGKALPTFYI
ncbi:hypothetical protein VTJ04DRAFT_2524 [Mycothermus thermophilus]|uniref:uncharacterized protein n=1 Tax=Humicola insolens TaxID=85995 RepID=UPI0037443926